MATETRIRRVSKTELGAVLDSLGENVKSYVAAKDVSDNKDYTVVYEYTLPTMTATEPEDGDDLLGAELTDLQTDVVIGDNDISADIQYMEDYDGFETGAEGHFFAIKATSSTGQVYFTGITPNGSKRFKIYDADDDTNYDGVFIMRISNDNLEKIILSYVDGDEVTEKEYKCNFTYEPKEEDE